MLIDSGIGSDLEDINMHIVRVSKYIELDKQKALQELENMRQALMFICNSITPKYLAFVCLISEIDGEKLTDLSDDNISSILKKLSFVKKGHADDISEAVKKKLDIELDMYFPNLFESSKEKEAYDRLKQRTILILNSIIEGKDNAKDIEKIDNDMLSISKPKQFKGSKSAEVLFNKQFEKACILISQKTNLSPKTMTVLEFYTTLDEIKKQSEAEIKSMKARK